MPVEFPLLLALCSILSRASLVSIYLIAVCMSFRPAAIMKRLSTVFKRKSSNQVPQASPSATKSDAAEPTTTATSSVPKATGPFLGAIDQGTTSSRFLIFDKAGVIIAQHQLEFNQYYKHSG